MNTATNTDFVKLTDAELTAEVNKLNGKVIALQRSKAHKTADGRQAISVMQSQLHRMAMEQKRRHHAAMRDKHNITPSGA